MVLIIVIGIIASLTFTFFDELKRRQYQHLWKGFAKALGGSYYPTHPLPGEIKLRLQGTQVTIAARDALPATSAKTMTTVSTPMHGANDFNLSLSPEGVLASLGKVFGAQDIILGEQAFDHKFIVESNNELLCRLWLNAMIRPMLLLLESYQLSISDGSITLSKASLERDLAQLKHAAEVCAKLGKQTSKLSENWLTLAKRFEAKFKNLKGQNPLPHNTQLELDHHGCRYVIEVISTARAGVLTKITSAKPSAIGLFSIAPFPQPAFEGAHELRLPLMPKQYQVFAYNQEAATHTITEGVIQTIQKITPHAIVSTQHNLEILLPGFVYAPETIKAALDLATTFVSHAQGPYR